MRVNGHEPGSLPQYAMTTKVRPLEGFETRQIGEGNGDGFTPNRGKKGDSSTPIYGSVYHFEVTIMFKYHVK